MIEEKRQVLQTLEHEALTWDRREGDATKEATPEGQGRAAYAAKQAAIRRKLRDNFAAIWATMSTTSTDAGTGSAQTPSGPSQDDPDDLSEPLDMSDDEWGLPEDEEDSDGGEQLS